MRFADLHALPEDDRIALIGRATTEAGKPVAFMVDDEPEKVARYTRKIRERFPALEVGEPSPGPVARVVTIIVRPRPS